MGNFNRQKRNNLSVPDENICIALKPVKNILVSRFVPVSCKCILFLKRWFQYYPADT